MVTTIPNSTTAPVTTGLGTSATFAAASTPAMSYTQSATSPAMRTHSASGKRDSHVAIGVGVGVGVPVGLASLAGLFYLMRRHLKTRPEGLQKTHAVAKDKNDDRLPKTPGEQKKGELPAVENPRELMDTSGPKWELKGNPED